VASTYLALHCHIIFSTKDRFPLIERDWRDRLYTYMGGILNEMGVVPESIGGTADHAHILAGFRATHAIPGIVHDVKRGSSAWVHNELKHPKFAWQTGYAALTVSPSQTEAVKEYIEKQEEHHRHRSFQEEYRELLLKAGIEYDEQYLWG
jgi:REP element-mobilizing transposase RayT